MPTLMQERVAEKLIENMKAEHPKTKGEILAEVGYGSSTIEKKRSEIIANEGVQEALAKKLAIAKGVKAFTPENAKRVVAEIMENENAKEENRLRATDLVFKVTGAYAPLVTETRNLSLDMKVTAMAELTDEQLDALLNMPTDTKQIE